MNRSSLRRLQWTTYHLSQGCRSCSSQSISCTRLSHKISISQQHQKCGTEAMMAGGFCGRGGGSLSDMGQTQPCHEVFQAGRVYCKKSTQVNASIWNPWNTSYICQHQGTINIESIYLTSVLNHILYHVPTGTHYSTQGYCRGDERHPEVCIALCQVGCADHLIQKLLFCTK